MLIDALVKKGVLTQEEGRDIQTDIDTDRQTSPAGRFDLSPSVTRLKLYGDMRFRYQSNSIYGVLGPAGTPSAGAGAQIGNRDLWRYRARVGADYSFTGSFKAGLRLESSNNNDSTNVNFTDGFFKDGNQVYFGLYYLQWSPDFAFIPEELDITFTGGKMKPTFVLDETNWDVDIDPTGVAENFAWTGPAGWTFGLNTGQYIYKDTDNRAATAPGGTLNGGPGENDTWLLVNQVLARYEWEKKSSVQIAPLVENMVNPNGATDRLGAPAGTPVAAVPPAPVVTPAGGNFYDHFTILYIPVEVTWEAWNIPWTAAYTYGHNFDGGAMARALGNGAFDDQTDSHCLSLSAGSTERKGGWQVAACGIYREAYAANPNLVDNDWAGQAGNQEGFIVRGAYAFNDYLVGGVRYLWSTSIEERGITNEPALNNNVSSSQVVIIELSARF